MQDLSLYPKKEACSDVQGCGVRGGGGRGPKNQSNNKQETIPMGKTVMVLIIPEPKVRKATAKPVQKHKDKTAYNRKAKHKTPEWGSFFTPKVKT